MPAAALEESVDAAANDMIVLTDEELDEVVGGADVRNFNAQDFAYNKIGMCGCGLAH